MNRTAERFRQGKATVCLLCLLICAAVLLPMTVCAESGSADKNPYYSFTTIEELREILDRGSGKQVWATDRGEEAYELTEDLTVPDNSYVFFAAEQVTIAPGATLTIKKGGSLSCRNLLIQGTVIVEGSLSQMVRKEGEIVRLQIEGKLINNGWVHHDQILGLENLETGRDGRTIDINEKAKKTPAAQEPEPEPTEASAPEFSAKEKALRDLRMNMRRAWFRLRFFFLHYEAELRMLPVPVTVLLLSVFVIRLSRKHGKQKARRAGIPADRRAEAGAETAEKQHMFSDARRKRVERLDDWLKNGIIDRQEYKVLKERYMRTSERDG